MNYFIVIVLALAWAASLAAAYAKGRIDVEDELGNFEVEDV